MDWENLGLVLAIVGCFLLANGVLMRDPRALVAQHFARAAQPLRSLREVLFHRVQTALGFLFLTTGFALQLWGRAQPAREGGDLPGSTALWIGGIVVLAILLEGVGWWWSLYSFRRHVRAFLRVRAPDFAADMQLAREVGELYGVGSHGDDTVQSYLERLHTAVGVDPPGRARPARAPLRPEGAGGGEAEVEGDDGGAAFEPGPARGARRHPTPPM